MTTRKTESRLARALRASDGQETRQVRRAQWAALGHYRPVWQPLYHIPTKSRAQYEYENHAQRVLDREARRERVLSMAKGIFAMLTAPLLRRPFNYRRHQS